MHGMDWIIQAGNVTTCDDRYPLSEKPIHIHDQYILAFRVY
jgi:hypothetical protein